MDGHGVVIGKIQITNIFFKDGDLNKSIKNKLYEDLGMVNPYIEQQTPVVKSRVDKFKDFLKKHTDF